MEPREERKHAAKRVKEKEYRDREKTKRAFSPFSSAHSSVFFPFSASGEERRNRGAIGKEEQGRSTEGTFKMLLLLVGL